VRARRDAHASHLRAINVQRCTVLNIPGKRDVVPAVVRD
jgi:hypothetical protein